MSNQPGIIGGGARLQSDDAVYLAHISDAVNQLSLAPESHVNVVLRLNLLFFEKIIVGGKSLIGNKLISKLLIDESQAIKIMFREKVISPLLTFSEGEYAEDLPQLAAKMIDAKTIFGVKEDNLMRNAEIFRTSAPKLPGHQKHSIETDFRTTLSN